MTATLTTRQKALRFLYPLLLKLTTWAGKNIKILQNKQNVPPAEPIYSLSFIKNNNTTLPLQQLKGKKLLLVNTASNCGYTAQYNQLQQLQNQYGEELVVIGFPANDFKNQEAGTDETIAQFCQLNFGVTFPLAKKSSVVKGSAQNPIFEWLSNKSKNGWNTQAPSWNFSKYLVNENGVLTHYFDPSISPLSKEVINALSTK